MARELKAMTSKIKPLFNSFHETSEQNLVSDLIEEVIQVHGINVWYIPRTLVKEDYLFGEDPLAAFNDGFEIEMYLETFEQYQGAGDMLTKFGLHIKDEAKLTVHARRFRTETNMLEPLEGDLVYIPLTNAVFEIRFVEDEVQFYALGKVYQYKLHCELFTFNREDFDTGVEPVDFMAEALDDSDGKTGEDLYGAGTKLETEGDAAIDATQKHIFGGN